MNSLWLRLPLGARLFDVGLCIIFVPIFRFPFIFCLIFATFSYETLDYDALIRNRRVEHTFLQVGSTSRREHSLRALFSCLVRIPGHIDTDVDALHI